MRDWTIYVRGFIAAVVIVITFDLTRKTDVAMPAASSAQQSSTASDPKSDAAAIPKDWEAIFVLVIGDYFAERPKADAARAFGVAADSATTSSAITESLVQCALALLLIGATVWLFGEKLAIPEAPYRLAVDGAWVAGVAIAVGF
jgi:hypothetical protein